MKSFVGNMRDAPNRLGPKFGPKQRGAQYNEGEKDGQHRAPLTRQHVPDRSSVALDQASDYHQ
jgi:hypothetical protein